MENTSNDSNDAQSVPKALHVSNSTALRLDSFGQLLKNSWQFFKTHFKPIFTFFFLLGFLPALLQITAQYFAVKLKIAVDSPTAALLLILLTGIITFVVNLLVQVLNFGAIRKLSDLDLGVTQGVFASWKKILMYTFPVIWVCIISFAMILGGMITFIVPGILFAISASFIGATVVIENRNGRDALVQSFWYTNNRRIEVFGRSLLMCLVLLGAAILMFIVLASIAIGVSIAIFGSVDQAENIVTNFILINGGNKFTPPTDIFFGTLIIWSLIGSAISAIFWGGFSAFNFKLWKNAKETSVQVVPEDFNRKTKNQIKIFGWIGVSTLLFWIVFLIFVSQMQRVDNAELEMMQDFRNSQIAPAADAN